MIDTPPDVANCKSHVANCSLKTTEPLSDAPDAKNGRATPFAICNLQFAICTIFLLLLCGVLFYYRLGDRDLWNSHEGRAAQAAQSVLNSGDSLLPHLFDGRIEMQKPPLYYWLVAGVAWLPRT